MEKKERRKPGSQCFSLSECCCRGSGCKGPQGAERLRHSTRNSAAHRLPSSCHRGRRRRYRELGVAGVGSQPPSRCIRSYPSCTKIQKSKPRQGSSYPILHFTLGPKTNLAFVLYNAVAEEFTVAREVLIVVRHEASFGLRGLTASHGHVLLSLGAEHLQEGELISRNGVFELKRCTQSIRTKEH